MVVSITASAGESTRRLDLEFRRSGMIEAHRLTLMPPRLLPVRLEPGLAANDDAGPEGSTWRRLLPHIRKVDLSREVQPDADSRSALLFVRDSVVLPSYKLGPPSTVARRAHAPWFDYSLDQGSFSATRNGSTIDISARGISRQQLSSVRPDGTTPGPLTAAARASATPAPAEPEIVAASDMRVPAFARMHADVAGNPAGQSRFKLERGYLDLINIESLEQERQCLAEAIYFEARSEQESGQAAVAQVILNRVRSGLYPTNVCGVVYQNRHRYKACQFTFACEGKALAIAEPASWAVAQRIAREVMEGASYNVDVGTATHYHATYVSPHWSRKLKRTDQIGRHIFYRLRPGQT